MHFLAKTTTRVLFAALVFAGSATLPVLGQPVAKKDASAAGALRLPSGAIIVLSKDLESIDKPDGVYLSIEKYKELVNQIESLRKQAAAEKMQAPSACELSGNLEIRGAQVIVRLNAAYRFRTFSPRSMVALGCQKAQPVEAKWEDGKLPTLVCNEKGLSVLVENVGEHNLRLDLEIPLQTRLGEAGFELGLPGAPITTLTFSGPEKARRFTLSRRLLVSSPTTTVEPAAEITRVDAEQMLPGRPGAALGPSIHLGVWWENADQPNAAPAVRSTEADIQVKISDAEIQTDVRLRLRGSAKEWRLFAPSTAEVTVGKAPAAGSNSKPADFLPGQGPEEIVRPEPGKSEWQIRFRELNTTELLVVISARSARNRGDGKSRTLWTVGPFGAMNVPRQEGTIRVHTPSHIRALGILKGETQRLDVADDANGESVYHYRSLPNALKDQLSAPLELDIRTLAGVIQTKTHHSFHLGDGGWHLRSEVKVTPIRTEVETLDLEVPVPGVFEATSPKLVEGIVPLRDVGSTRRVVQIKLANPQRSEFTFSLDGTYPLPLNAAEAVLTLPRFLNVLDRNDEAVVMVPPSSELRGGVYQWQGDKPGTRMQALEPTTVEGAPAYTVVLSRGLAQVELAWRPLREDLRVNAVTDIALGERSAHASQQLNLTFAERPQRRLRLHGSPSLANLSVNVGTLENEQPGEWNLHLPDDVNKEVALTLSWTFALPSISEDGGKLPVPLCWIDGAASYDSRIRFWRERDSAGQLLPQHEPGAWQELPIELSTTGATLLVLRSAGVDVPLTIALRGNDGATAVLPQAWVERTLIQAQSADTMQRYRARFYLNRWTTRFVDFEIPLAATGIELRLNGARADQRELPADGDGARVIRVALPTWRERLKLLVDLKYNVPSSMVEGWSMAITRWQPPRPRGRVAMAAVRWQFALPQRCVPISLGDAAFEERWTIQNGYAQPAPAYGTAEIDQWITIGDEPEGGEPLWGSETFSMALTARQSNLSTVRLLAVPRTAFFAVVSLLTFGLGMLVSRLPARGAGVAVVLIGTVMLMVGVLWPQPMAQLVMGAQPGLLLLIAVLGLQQFLHWRHRRHLTRMPGFTRLTSESALSRVNGSRSNRETSTVDVPAGN